MFDSTIHNCKRLGSVEGRAEGLLGILFESGTTRVGYPPSEGLANLFRFHKSILFQLIESFTSTSYRAKPHDVGDFLRRKKGVRRLTKRGEKITIGMVWRTSTHFRSQLRGHLMYHSVGNNGFGEVNCPVVVSSSGNTKLVHGNNMANDRHWFRRPILLGKWVGECTPNPCGRAEAMNNNHDRASTNEGVRQNGTDTQSPDSGGILTDGGSDVTCPAESCDGIHVLDSNLTQSIASNVIVFSCTTRFCDETTMMTAPEARERGIDFDRGGA